MGLEKELVRVCSSSLYLMITTAPYSVDLVFRTLVSNIFRGKSLGASRIDMNDCVIDLSAKCLLRVLPFVVMCRCASGIVVPISMGS